MITDIMVAYILLALDKGRLLDLTEKHFIKGILSLLYLSCSLPMCKVDLLFV